MKIKILLLFVWAVITLPLLAQKSTPTKMLKKVKTLKLPEIADNEYPGTRGASIAWHPVQKKYYTAMAGNALYPLNVFDESGKEISNNKLTCEQDVRGLWYNTTTKRLEGNTYNNNGWFYYGLNANGLITKNETFVNGMQQPEGQSTGVYDAKTKSIFFIEYDTVYSYAINGTNKILKKYALTLGYEVAPKGDVFYEALEEVENYNQGTLVATNIAKMEIGLLNIVQNKIELYNLATGLIKQNLIFPEDITLPANFGFAFANGIYWIFDQTNREWVGYK